jgi:dihydrofolate reductase
VFVLGGAEIFARALPLADELELTEIDAEFPADTFFPPWNRGEFRQTSCEAQATPEGLAYRYASYRRITPGE